jgi:hypothetical protein
MGMLAAGLGYTFYRALRTASGTDPVAHDVLIAAMMPYPTPAALAAIAPPGAAGG